jgi:hypothetical protein
MTAEIRHESRQDSGLGALTRGTGFGRGGGRDSFVERREAAQRRLSSTVRAAELVECALRGLDEAMAEHCVVDRDGSLRPTVRALLGLAYAAADYDVTVLPASADVAVRVRHTPFGPEAEVVDIAAAGGESPTTTTALALLAAAVTPTVSAPTPAVPRTPIVSARTASVVADDGAAGDGTVVVAAEPASPWWTPETPSR